MAVALEQFVKQIEDSGVIAPGKLEIFVPPKARPKDAQELAQQLVRSRHLTAFQAQEIYQGRAKSLILGNYTILDKIGAGGMGQVFKAEHRRMKRIVAIKMLPRNLTRDALSVLRFQREVEAAAKLSHPNIVAAYDADEASGIRFLVMEYVAGSDLSALVKKHGPLSVAKAVNYVLQAAHGLEFAHRKGVIHRDVKPGNLLLDAEGTVKILDMGLARLSSDGNAVTQAELTGTGAVLGTIDYMAPEQADDTKHADARADIYALGCTLYRLLTSHVPYKGETLIQILMAHRESPIPSICKDRPDVPPQLDAVFKKMVAKKPEERYQTMTEVMTALNACVDKRSAKAASVAEDATAAFPAEDNLAFLRGTSPRSMGTAVKKQVERPAAANVSRRSAIEETSKHLGRGTKLLVVSRKTKLPFVGIGLGVLGVIAVIALTLIVRIRRPDRTEQESRFPDGTEAIASKPALPRTTRAVPGKEQRVRVPSSFIGPDGKWRLPPGAPLPAIAPFDARKATEHQEAWAKYLGMPVEIINSIGMKLLLIPPGEFEMGSLQQVTGDELKTAPKDDGWYLKRLSGEGPRHHVRITRPFYLGMYLVTQEEYEKVTGTSPSEFSATGKFEDRIAGQDTKRLPVDNVSWQDTREFCSRLSEMAEEKLAGRRYRLPSEAQWEYACRAGTTGRRFFSPALSVRTASGEDQLEESQLFEYAWFLGNSGMRTHAVGGRRASAWGLCDMYGNVWQWCQDWYDEGYYANSKIDNPAGPTEGSLRVMRGGSCFNNSWYCRSAYRFGQAPAFRYGDLGFRVSLVPAE